MRGGILRGVIFAMWVETFLPIQIAQYKAQGGPTGADFDRIASYADEIASRTDIFMGQGKPGETGALAAKILDAAAVLSFLPGESQNGGQCDSIGKMIRQIREVQL